MAWGGLASMSGVKKFVLLGVASASRTGSSLECSRVDVCLSFKQCCSRARTTSGSIKPLWSFYKTRCPFETRTDGFKSQPRRSLRDPFRSRYESFCRGFCFSNPAQRSYLSTIRLLSRRAETSLTVHLYCPQEWLF